MTFTVYIQAKDTSKNITRCRIEMVDALSVEEAEGKAMRFAYWLWPIKEGYRNHFFMSSDMTDDVLLPESDWDQYDRDRMNQ